MMANMNTPNISPIGTNTSPAAKTFFTVLI